MGDFAEGIFMMTFTWYVTKWQFGTTLEMWQTALCCLIIRVGKYLLFGR